MNPMTSDTLGVEELREAIARIVRLAMLDEPHHLPTVASRALVRKLTAQEAADAILALLPKGVDRGGKEEEGVSQSQPCGEASADAEVFAGLDAERAAASAADAQFWKAEWHKLDATRDDLLEALQYAANSLEAMRPTFSQVKDEGHAFHDQVLDAARAAIAKALSASPASPAGVSDEVPGKPENPALGASS